MSDCVESFVLCRDNFEIIEHDALSCGVRDVMSASSWMVWWRGLKCEIVNVLPIKRHEIQAASNHNASPGPSSSVASENALFSRASADVLIFLWIRIRHRVC
jgi:hypothetical protein